MLHFLPGLHLKSRVYKSKLNTSPGTKTFFELAAWQRYRRSRQILSFLRLKTHDRNSRKELSY